MNYLQSQLSSLYPSFEAEQPGLCQTLSETPKISFLTMLPIWCKTLSFEQVNAKKHIRIVITKMNQRTNGPVNAHLISGPTVSTKTSFANLNIVIKWVKVNSQSSFI